ncbi:MAG TPA: radical SAM protein, partial [Bacteroidales bacterium]|nr:radical SAM protein [Bacteroidales bacterium]
MNTENLYQNCKCCPHNCNVNRTIGEVGICKTNDNPLVASVFLHKGEEPVISGEKGICNVFFAHCNLQCIYCQNYQISKNLSNDKKWKKSIGEVVDEIVSILNIGVKLLGFVSPSHQIKQMLEIIDELQRRGFKPVIVYNSNGYDSVETLKMLDGIVDVYLPDFKYNSNKLAYEYSGVNDYFEVATSALLEMYRQKGSTILLDDDGLIEFQLIHHHL